MTGVQTCALPICIYGDFGWSGAAGAFLAIDRSHRLTLCYVQHLLKAPNRSLRLPIYDFVMADCFGDKVFQQLILKEKYADEIGVAF